MLPELLGATEPGTYYGSPPAGALGWGLPAALGVQLASPDRTVVATVGDGAYMFANPAACHHAMARHGLPVLVVVATNSVWGAVDGSTLGMYPKESSPPAAARASSPSSTRSRSSSGTPRPPAGSGSWYTSGTSLSPPYAPPSR
ncbi:thiamine pyrophosphate-dependent enzyme [Phytohabitans flavus]|uniref:thiamine pyrophosphate-dependent enzyme n=1 Tax=Phytohabitans flavus TaxID=1076124 RepID=UPI003633BB71